MSTSSRAEGVLDSASLDSAGLDALELDGWIGFEPGKVLARIRPPSISSFPSLRVLVYNHHHHFPSLLLQLSWSRSIHGCWESIGRVLALFPFSSSLIPWDGDAPARLIMLRTRRVCHTKMSGVCVRVCVWARGIRGEKKGYRPVQLPSDSCPSRVGLIW